MRAQNIGDWRFMMVQMVELKRCFCGRWLAIGGVNSEVLYLVAVEAHALTHRCHQVNHMKYADLITVKITEILKNTVSRCTI